MNNTQKYWQPSGSLTESQARALSVRATETPDLTQHKYLLAQRLQELIDQDPAAARMALEMSQEHLPELYSIAQNRFQKEWAQSLMSSDSMHSLIARVDWNLPGKLTSRPGPESLQELLEELP